MLNPVLIGIVTVHVAFGAVLANFPQRADPSVDGYVAVADCSWMGRWLVLELDGEAYQVRVADCLAPQDRPGNLSMFAGRWVADVDVTLWGDHVWVPRAAALWSPRAWAMEQARWQRVE